MIPHKTPRGAAALERLKAFEGVPFPYDKVGGHQPAPHSSPCTRMRTPPRIASPASQPASPCLGTWWRGGTEASSRGITQAAQTATATRWRQWTGGQCSTPPADARVETQVTKCRPHAHCLPAGEAHGGARRPQGAAPAARPPLLPAGRPGGVCGLEAQGGGGAAGGQAEGQGGGSLSLPPRAPWGWHAEARIPACGAAVSAREAGEPLGALSRLNGGCQSNGAGPLAGCERDMPCSVALLRSARRCLTAVPASLLGRQEPHLPSHSAPASPPPSAAFNTPPACAVCCLLRGEEEAACPARQGRGSGGRPVISRPLLNPLRATAAPVW